MNWRIAVLIMGSIFVLLTGVLACDREAEAQSEELTVVTTTTMLADLVEELGGEYIDVHSLVGVGADPHVYQPRPNDARTISQSDAVVMNGLLLEGWMESLVNNAGGERPVIVGGEAVDEAELIQVEGAVDPHIWFNVEMWRQVAEMVAEELIELAGDDEIVAESIRARHAEYDQVLQELDRWVQEQMETIPSGQRVLITSHDAFNYFGAAYGIDVESVQGLSTEQEASQRDVINIIELVEKRGAPAVFTETSVHPGLIEQVARETGIVRAGPLHSDSVGSVESGADTYVGMVRTNVKMITEGLGGKYRAFEESAAVPDGNEGDGA